MKRSSLHIQKAAYIARVDIAQPHLAGVVDKIQAQVTALRELPAEVDLYCLSNGAVTKNGTALTRPASHVLNKRLIHYVGFHLVVARHAQGSDFIYLRYQGCSPLLLWSLGRIRRSNPRIKVIVEIPSYPYEAEANTVRTKVLSWIDRLSRRHLSSVTDRIVTFSKEKSIFGIPAINTDNGVETRDLPLLSDAPATPPLRLLGLANLSFWHGYDRVIAGLAEYYERGGTRDVLFEVVGAGAELARLKAQANETGMSARVRFHGPLRGAELDEVIARCHVGVSSIGMHRHTMDTSTLKSREYCARGLPFVLGHADRDFGLDFPFAFHAPADDSPLPIDRVISFHDNLCFSTSDYRSQLRAYAEANLSWRAKMAPICQYLLTPDPSFVDIA